MFRNVLAIVLSLLAAATMAAPIYKWVDEKGVTHYSETPPPAHKAQEIQVQPAPPAGVEGGKAAAKSWQELDLEFRRRNMERQEAASREKATAKFTAFVRQERCIRATRNLHALQMERPVYWINENGERVYMNDGTRAAEVERLKKGTRFLLRASLITY